MKTKNACILLLAALALTACKYDDSALWEQVNQNTERIAALEAWQVETNTNIQSLQTLLNTADYITAVTPVTEEGVEVGYTITFLNSDPVTIYNGKDGEKGDTGETGATGAAGATPQIGVTQAEDGNWYWTLNGELLTDADGNSIRANGEKGEQGDKGDTGDTGAQGPQGDKGEQGDTGDTGATDTSAPVPQLKTGASLTNVTQDSEGAAIVDDAIYLSVDGGETWTRVSGEDGTDGKDGEDGTNGDSFFQSVDTSDPTCVIFTLAGGTTFSVPRYTGIKLNFGDTSSLLMAFDETQTVNFTAEGSDQFTTDNLFIVAPDGWKAEVTLPTRAATVFSLTVTAPANTTSGATEGEILVMLDNGQGSTTIGRLKVEVKYIIIDGTELTARGLEAGKLAEEIGDRTDLTSVTVTSGTLNEGDWEAIGKNKGTLLYLDLAGATYTGDDANNLIYKTTSESSGIISIKLPQGVTGLGKSAFQNCFALESIDLPDGVTSIGDDAFNYCTALESIDLPEGLTSIGNYAFNACIALTSIDLPEGLTSIGNYAFNACEALESIDLPDKVTSIGHCAFSGCKGLTSIDLPETLTTIGNNAFQKCTSLATITLPDGVTTIESATFSNCTSLKSITLPEGVTSIGDHAFDNCTSLTSIGLPDKVTSIGDYAFRKCTVLTSIDLPETLTSIGEFAFGGCDALESIDLPDKVTSIGESAFYDCNALKSIDLPDGLTSIGDMAFYHCDALETVICLATTPPTMGFKAFDECTNLKAIYVPASSEIDYKTAEGWFKYNIQAIQ